MKWLVTEKIKLSFINLSRLQRVCVTTVIEKQENICQTNVSMARMDNMAITYFMIREKIQKIDERLFFVQNESSKYLQRT